MEHNENAACERAVLVGLSAKVFEEKNRVTDHSMDELEALLNTAGGISLGRVVQNRESPEPKTFVGKGKAEEVREFAANCGANLIVFDNELSPAQTKNLEELIGVRVIDRSTLILDIFADRAITREGKLQVELAQYKYMLPRLTGKGVELSRLGGGIGTRGPGESKLETDRRHIRRHISRLEEELSEVRRVRNEQRRGRLKSETPHVAIVGYTNAGKSTLLNQLTGAGIHAENRLFDTLDPTTRRYRVSDTLEVVLSDTVGFISKLPHHLVEAFKATLEELSYADLLLHVIDSSDPQWRASARVVADIIRDLGAEDKPSVTVFNKIDLCTSPEDLPNGDDIVKISAMTGANIGALNSAMRSVLDTRRRRVRLLVPYSDASALDMLHRASKVLSEEYTADGIEIEAVCDEMCLGRVRAFVTEEDLP